MIGWITLGAGVWGAVLAYVVLDWAMRRRELRTRMHRGPGSGREPGAAGEFSTGSPNDPEYGMAAHKARWSRLSAVVGRGVRRAIPPSWASFVRRRLHAAGLRVTVEHFLGSWLLLLTTGYLLLSVLALTITLPTWLIVVMVAVILLIPFVHLSHQELERIRRIRREFPFLIDFVTMAVEAGVSLESSLVRASQRLRGPIGDELQRYVSNVNRGMTRREALLAFADGLSLPEVRDLVQALIQGTGFGLPMAEVLRRQAEQFREVRRMQAEETAQRIPTKLLFPLVLFIFPTIFLFVLGPAVIWLLEKGF